MPTLQKVTQEVTQEITQEISSMDMLLIFSSVPRTAVKLKKHFQLESEMGLITGQFYRAYNSVILIFKSVTLS